MFGGAKNFCPNSPKLARNKLHLNQSMLGAIYAHTLRDFVKVFRDFGRILRDFSRIFTTSKLLGVCLNPLHPRLLHQWIYRSTVSEGSDKDMRCFEIS